MRSFKIFFKHTWHPQQMDNSVRLAGSTIGPCELRTAAAATAASDTELGELKSANSIVETGTGHHHQSRIGIPCHNGACKTSTIRGQYVGGGSVEAAHHSRLDSPWHYLKTCFLVSTIVALLIWILVYVLLSQYEIL